MVTTTETIKQHVPRPCAKCGWPIDVGVVRADHSVDHLFDCPEGPAPERVAPAIAHDPLDPKEGASAAALRALQKRGIRHSITRTRPSGPPIDAVIGNLTWRREMRDVDAILADREAERLHAISYPPPVGVEEEPIGLDEVGPVGIVQPPVPGRGGYAPLGRRRRG